VLLGMSRWLCSTLGDVAEMNADCRVCKQVKPGPMPIRTARAAAQPFACSDCLEEAAKMKDEEE